MDQKQIPDVRVQMKGIVHGLRMACFPMTLWKFAGAQSWSFVPSRSQSEATRAKVMQLQNDPDFRHWISENAELLDVVTCRFAIELMSAEIEGASEARLAELGARLLRLPMFAPIVADSLDLLSSRCSS